MACKVKGKTSNICKFKDALAPNLEEIALADGLVLGSPIYFGDVTDRCALSSNGLPSRGFPTTTTA